MVCMAKLVKRTLQVLFLSSLFMAFFVSISCDKGKETLASESEKSESVQEKTEGENVQNEDKKAKDDEIIDIASEAKEKEEQRPPTPKEIGYAYGAILAKAIKMNHLEIDAKAVYKGLLDNIDEKDVIIKPHESVLIRAFAEGKAKYAAENLKRQNEFLEANKTKEGVITRESGLQYKVLKKAEDGAKKPTEGQKVKVIYEGKALDKENNFDSSNGEAVEFSLENVVEGWKEMVPLMSVGDEVEVYIPSDLGYKESGISYGGQEIIPPNALLIFKIELVEIVEPEKTEEGATSTTEQAGN